jgi:hypothetical protein
LQRWRPRLKAVVLGAVCAPAALALAIFDQNKPELFDDILEHYKYGSIGAEARTGFPYWIWAVLPTLFPQHLPAKPGNGYERFGFIFEPGKARPIGTSLRERQVPFIGLNCAVCHTGTVRETPGEARRVILGMPSHQIDLQSYQRFLFKCFGDPGFTADRVWPAIRQANPSLGWLDAAIYKFVVIPRTKREGMEVASASSWTDARPPTGPGRVDTFNPYKVIFKFNMAEDHSVGTTDLPSLWNQKIRDGMWLHWDGNNDSVVERNKSAAIGAGANPDSLDLPSMKRIEDWIWTLPSPKIAAGHVDAKRALAGEALYKTHCADCHDPGGKRVGQTIPLDEVRTDPERLHSFTPALAEKMNTLGEGYPWKFSHFRKTNGYAGMPLDGVWARAPYLHNGSVPTLKHLLETEENRPAVFARGYDVYDYENGGFVWSGPDAERLGFRFDTSVKGNGRGGHYWGTELKEAEKQNLVEYLKTK